LAHPNRGLRDDRVGPLDWFDLLMHGTPWVLVMLKIWGIFSGRADGQG